MDIDNSKGIVAAIVQRLFALGFICATPQVVEKLSGEEVRNAIARHAAGDWGEVGPEDRQSNEEALETGARLFSVYPTADGDARFWIITEADRSVTTVLFPDEY